MSSIFVLCLPNWFQNSDQYPPSLFSLSLSPLRCLSMLMFALGSSFEPPNGSLVWNEFSVRRPSNFSFFPNSDSKSDGNHLSSKVLSLWVRPRTKLILMYSKLEFPILTSNSLKTAASAGPNLFRFVYNSVLISLSIFQFFTLNLPRRKAFAVWRESLQSVSCFPDLSIPTIIHSLCRST